MTTAIAQQAAIDGTKAIATKVDLYSSAPSDADHTGTAISGATGIAVTWSGNVGSASVTGLPTSTSVVAFGLTNAAGALIKSVTLGAPVTLTTGAANITATLS